MASSVIGALRANLGLNSAQFEAGLKKSDRAVQGFGRSMMKVAAGLGAAFGAALSVRAIGQASDQWSDLSSRVGNAVGSMEAAPEVMSRIQDMARASYSDLSQTAEAFVANSQALKDLGMSTAEQLDYTEALNNALVISGAKGQHAAQVQDALSKAMATGKLSGDGLNTVLSRGGRVAQALADELGTTVSGLRAVGAQGGITGDVISRALTDRLQELRDEAAEMPATIADGMTLIRNSMLALVGIMDQTTGASSGIAEALVGIADAISAVTKWISTHGEVISTVFNTMLGSAAVLAAFFAGKYAVSVGVTAVKAMVSAWRSSVALNMALGAQSLAAARAGVAIKALTAGLRVLRGAIISTGIGALVVAAGYLVGKFVELVSAAGGFGAALSLLGEVAREVWDRIGAHMDVARVRSEATWKDIQAQAHEVFASIVEGAIWLANRRIGIDRGAFNAVVAIWGALPGAIGDLAFQAANALIRAVSWMLSQISKPIDAFIGGVNKVREAVGAEPLDLIGEVKLPPLDNPYANGMRDLGSAAADAFMEGFNTDTIGSPDGFLGGIRGTAAELRGQADAYREAAGVLAQAAARPMTAWQRLKGLLRGTKDEASDIPPIAGDAGAALEDLGKKGGAAGKQAADGIKKAKDTVDEMKQASERGESALSSLFGSIVDGSKSAKDAVADLLAEIAKAQFMKGLFMLPGMSEIASGTGSLLGANANGTNNWRGGLSRIHERGGEIVDLPSGSRVIPHDVSMRMAKEAGDTGGGHMSIGFDKSTGDLTATMYDIAGNVVSSARQTIVRDSVAGAGRAMRQTKSFGGRL